MGGIGGSIDRALAEELGKAGAVGTQEHLRRLMVPGLATWDGQANAAKRLVAPEAELILAAAEGAHLIACDERGKTYSSRAFADHIALFGVGVSLGEVDTLVYPMPKRGGIFRISVGIESFDDIRADFDRALGHVR